MKKIVRLIFIIGLIFFSIMNFLDYSNENVKNIENNKTVIEIEKPKNLTNENFINTLVKLFKDMNSNIIYITTENSGLKSHKQYYTTTNKNTILNNENKKEILDKGEYLSTFYTNSDFTHSIIGSTFFYNISIYNFKEIKKFNLDLCKYYVDNNMSNTVIEKLKSNGFTVNKINRQVSNFKYVSLTTMFLPAFLLFISMTFYVISRRKEILCQKLLGYSKFNIIFEDCFKNLIYFLVITFIIEILNFSLVEILYKHSFIQYFNFTYKKIFIILLYTILVLLITNMLNITKNYISYLKGNNKNLDIYIITLISKVTFCIFLIINLNSISFYISSIYDLNKINMDISSRVKNYVTLPVNVSNYYIGEGNQLELSNRAEEFYNDTVNKFNGVLIDTRQYRKINDDDSDIPEDENYKKYITINGNYLKLNSIHDIGNNLITSDLLREEDFNILIPENENENKIKTLYSKQYNVDIDNINIIKYLNNEKIYSFNPYSGINNNGLINNPIIFIYNSKFIKHQMLNYISGQYYFIKIDSNNPFDEIHPVLKNYGLDTIIHQTPYIANVFNESIWQIKNNLIISLVNLCIYILGILVMIIYSSKIYFTIYNKYISLKRLSGYNFIEIYKVPLIIQWIQLIILILLRNKFKMNTFIIFIVSIVELIIFIMYLKYTEAKNIITIMKGEN